MNKYLFSQSNCMTAWKFNNSNKDSFISWRRKKDRNKKRMLTFAMTLTFKCTKLSAQLVVHGNVPLFMVMYHCTKFGCQRFTSSEDIRIKVFPDNLNPCCDLDFEDSNPMLLLDTPICDDNWYIYTNIPSKVVAKVWRCGMNIISFRSGTILSVWLRPWKQRANLFA